MLAQVVLPAVRSMLPAQQRCRRPPGPPHRFQGARRGVAKARGGFLSSSLDPASLEPPHSQPALPSSEASRTTWKNTVGAHFGRTFFSTGGWLFRVQCITDSRSRALASWHGVGDGDNDDISALEPDDVVETSFWRRQSRPLRFLARFVQGNPRRDFPPVLQRHFDTTSRTHHRGSQRTETMCED